MSRDLGSYNTATTRTHVRFQFSTHAAAGGNVAPSSAFEAADLRIYRANDAAAYSATQRSSASGITMTSPFDSLAGVHDVDIDLTDNTDAGFYAAGYRYSVVLAPDETVDSQTITGVVLAEFEIGPPPVNVTQLLGTAWLTPGTAGTPDVNVKLISDDATAANNAESFFDGTGYAGTNNVIPTVTTLTNLPAITSNWLTAAGIATDAGTEIAAAVWNSAMSSYQSAGSMGLAVNELDTIYTNAYDGVTARVLANVTHANGTLYSTAVTTPLANLATAVDALPTNAELATALAAADDAVLAAIAALNNLSSAGAASAVTTALTTALTEGYRGTGATGSVRDLLYEVIAHLGESSISSTTKTLKKIDGSTTAKTYSLNDATTPTAISETT